MLMQKGYKRKAKGMAVLYCFIGLLLLFIIVILGYFALNMDYSDKLAPDASMRPYVEVSPSPTPDPQSVVISTPFPAVTPTPTPTAEPTSTPTPSPSPTPTPEPTSIPAELAAPMMTSGFQLPELSALDVKLGITSSYRSAVDGNKYIQLRGYAYVNDANFDAVNSQMFLVITQDSTGYSILALPNKVEGVSGVDHSDALCANAAASDFEIVLNVTQFPDEIYSLGMVFMYTGLDGADHLEYVHFAEGTSFTVLGSQAISDVPVVTE